MSSSELESETSSESFDGEFTDYEDEIEDFVTVEPNAQTTADAEIDDVDEGAYQDEPIASQEWIEYYNKRQREIKELEENLTKRLSGEVTVNDWCTCGNCQTTALQNISECYCCTELEGCLDSLTTDLVQQDLSPEVTLKCVTEHPGFQPVCLQKWSLRMAADRFKTKEKQRYRQTGSEESFLRSIAYREFSRLIYGWLGAKRIPLPACAYVAIRTTFPVSSNSEGYTGFDLDESDEDQ